MQAIGVMSAILLLAAGTSVPAQLPADIVKWSVKDGPREVKAGAAVSVELTADVAPGWHLYALTQPAGGPNPLRIAVSKGKPFEVRTQGITAPAPVVTRDEIFGVATRQHDGAVAFKVPIAATRTAAAGGHAVPIEITFQACGNGICLRPFTQTLSIDLVVSK